MRLIDADELCKLVQNSNDKTVDCNDIMRMAVIDAKPVKHGKWIEQADGNYICISCGEYAERDAKEDFILSKFCPNCGARMDG